jgi:hypothetical protein
VRKNALIARKQAVWQGYLTCEKTEKGRKISDRTGAKGSAKKGQKRRELTPTDDLNPQWGKKWGKNQLHEKTMSHKKSSHR